MAKKAKTVTTVQFENQVGVSGTLRNMYLYDGRASYLFWEGPVQLTLQKKELPGQGVARHHSGFSMPVGSLLNSSKKISDLSLEDLESLGIEKESTCRLAYTSGTVVTGWVKDIVFHDKKALYIVWQDCQVTQGKELLYDPSWGEFDMPLCSDIASVFGGPADLGPFGEYDIGKASSAPSRSTPYSAEERRIHSLFAQIKSLRLSPSKPDDLARLLEIAAEILNGSKFEWLLAIELMEVLACRNMEIKNSFEELRQRLLDPTQHSEAAQKMIQLGLEIMAIPDSWSGV